MASIMELYLSTLEFNSRKAPSKQRNTPNRG